MIDKLNYLQRSEHENLCRSSLEQAIKEQDPPTETEKESGICATTLSSITQQILHNYPKKGIRIYLITLLQKLRMKKMPNILPKIEKQKWHTLEKTAQQIQMAILWDLHQVLGADAVIPEDAAKDLILQVTCLNVKPLLRMVYFLHIIPHVSMFFSILYFIRV